MPCILMYAFIVSTLMPELTPTPAGRPSLPWKKIFSIASWLWIFPPWGIWLLWKDTEFSRVAKWRIFVYSFLIPTVLMMAVSMLSLWRLGSVLSGMNI